jgi:hypothetical protein
LLEEGLDAVFARAADESAGRVVLVELRDRTDEHEGTVELVLRVVPAPPDRQ